MLLAYDVTRLDSFENVINWMRQVQKNARDDVEKLLVGNKIDMVDIRKVTKERGTQLALEFGIPFIETSAKSGENVSKAFVDVTMSLLRNPNIVASTAGRPSTAFRVEPPSSTQRSYFSSSNCC